MGGRRAPAGVPARIAGPPRRETPAAPLRFPADIDPTRHCRAVAGATPGSRNPRTIDRLLVYGTLAPGQPNARVLADVPGTWEPAAVTGILLAEGCDAAAGFPGLVLGAHGETVHGLILHSPVLHERWARLDAFEGDGDARCRSWLGSRTVGQWMPVSTVSATRACRKGSCGAGK